METDNWRQQMNILLGDATDKCKDYKKEHIPKKNCFMGMIFILSCILLFFTAIFILSGLTIDNNLKYIFYIIAVPLLGVSVSLYKYHLSEISKYEHYILGFSRVNIAAVGSAESFQSEVRSGLINGAFPDMIGKEKTKNSALLKRKVARKKADAHIKV